MSSECQGSLSVVPTGLSSQCVLVWDEVCKVNSDGFVSIDCMHQFVPGAANIILPFDCVPFAPSYIMSGVIAGKLARGSLCVCFVSLLYTMYVVQSNLAGRRDLVVILFANGDQPFVEPP